MGIEPTYLAWKASVLPLNYARTRQYFIISKNKPFTKLSDEKAPWPLREKRPPCGSLCFIIAKYKGKMGPFYEKSAGLKFRQKKEGGLVPYKRRTLKRVMVALPYW